MLELLKDIIEIRPPTIEDNFFNLLWTFWYACYETFINVLNLMYSDIYIAPLDITFNLFELCFGALFIYVLTYGIVKFFISVAND